MNQLFGIAHDPMTFPQLGQFGGGATGRNNEGLLTVPLDFGRNASGKDLVDNPIELPA